MGEKRPPRDRLSEALWRGSDDQGWPGPQDVTVRASKLLWIECLPTAAVPAPGELKGNLRASGKPMSRDQLSALPLPLHGP